MINVSAKVLEFLFEALHSELVGITQYMAHHEMFEDAGYPTLAKMLYKDGMDEMEHYEQIADRLLYLGHTPKITQPVVPFVPDALDIVKMLESSRALESEAVSMYNRGIRLSFDENDHGTRAILEKFLVDEEQHYDDLDTLCTLIATHGNEYLARLAALPGELGEAESGG